MITRREFIKQTYGTGRDMAKALGVTPQSISSYNKEPIQFYKHLDQLKRDSGLSADEIIKILHNE